MQTTIYCNPNSLICLNFSPKTATNNVHTCTCVYWLIYILGCHKHNISVYILICNRAGCNCNVYTYVCICICTYVHTYVDCVFLFRQCCQDVTICAACAPPGGGRNPVTPRFIRHFSMFCIPSPSEVSLKVIFKVHMQVCVCLCVLPQALYTCMYVV